MGRRNKQTTTLTFIYSDQLQSYITVSSIKATVEQSDQIQLGIQFGFAIILLCLLMY